MRRGTVEWWPGCGTPWVAPGEVSHAAPPAGELRQAIEERLRVLRDQRAGASWSERRRLSRSIERLERWRDTGEIHVR
jgi:hypothetical protein